LETTRISNIIKRSNKYILDDTSVVMLTKKAKCDMNLLEIDGIKLVLFIIYQYGGDMQVVSV